MKIVANNETFDIEFKHSVVPTVYVKQIREFTGKRQVSCQGEAEQTQCFIRQNGIEFVGTARRYNKDKCNRVVARTVAFNRALSHLDATTRAALTHAVPFRLA